jgi:hypothetical protein
MSDNNPLVAGRVRKDAFDLSGVDIPISGGSGLSREDPIVIEDTDPAKSAFWEHQVVGFIYRMREEEWSFEKSTVETINGRQIEQFKITRSGDIDNYYNFYFDVTAALGRNDDQL